MLLYTMIFQYIYIYIQHIRRWAGLAYINWIQETISPIFGAWCTISSPQKRMQGPGANSILCHAVYSPGTGWLEKLQYLWFHLILWCWLYAARFNSYKILQVVSCLRLPRVAFHRAACYRWQWLPSEKSSAILRKFGGWSRTGLHFEAVDGGSFVVVTLW